jgi:hypothetical protein
MHNLHKNMIYPQLFCNIQEAIQLACCRYKHNTDKLPNNLYFVLMLVSFGSDTFPQHCVSRALYAMWSCSQHWEAHIAPRWCVWTTTEMGRCEASMATNVRTKVFFFFFSKAVQKQLTDSLIPILEKYAVELRYLHLALKIWILLGLFHVACALTL